MEDKIIKSIVGFEELKIYDRFVKSHVAGKVSGSIRKVTYNQETKEVKFYTDAEITETSTPVLTITIPTTDVSGFLNKIESGTAGNVVAVGTNGQIVDSGVAVQNLATKEYVAQTAAGHITKQIVTQTELDALIADVSTAQDNVLYLLKDEAVEGDDKYFEYTLINGAVTCIGSTSVSIEGLATEASVNEVKSDVETMNTSFDTRLKALEAIELTNVTEEQIAAMFADDTTPDTPTE